MADPAKNKKLKISETQELKILRTIVDITSSELDLTWVLKEIVKIVTDITKGDSVFIYLLTHMTISLIVMNRID